jgi:hypothetical protein
MADTVASNRAEPIFQDTAASRAAEELRAAVEAPQAPQLGSGAASLDQATRAAIDQLSRIEDKAARIEEKYARTEAILLRVEDKLDHVASRSADAARQPELSATRQELANLSRQVQRLPSGTALFAVAIVTALATTVLTVVTLKYDLVGMLLR